MEAQHVAELPQPDGWQYEPKWTLPRRARERRRRAWPLSRNGRPLLRYFPELALLGEQLPPSSALDGEIVIEREGALDFDAMATPTPPRAASASSPRSRHGSSPSTSCSGTASPCTSGHRGAPVELEKHGDFFTLSPATRDRAQAEQWFERPEAARLDGVVASDSGLPYLPGCVTASSRSSATGRPTTWSPASAGRRTGRSPCSCWASTRTTASSGYVGSAAVPAKNEAEIHARIEPLLKDAPDRQARSRAAGATLGFEEAAVRPELVVEIRFDKLERHRFRHGTRLLRFREDNPRPAAVHVARGAAAAKGRPDRRGPARRLVSGRASEYPGGVAEQQREHTLHVTLEPLDEYVLIEAADSPRPGRAAA